MWSNGGGKDSELAASAERACAYREIARFDGGGHAGHAPQWRGDHAREPAARSNRHQERERADGKE